MKSLLVCLIFAACLLSGLYPTTGAPQPPADTARSIRAGSPGQEYLSEFYQQPRAPDHPVTLGETARDIGGGGPAEHLAPLIFLVMAFLISFLGGCLWWNRFVLHGRNDNDVSPIGRFRKSILTMAGVSAVFSLVATLLLLNVINYLADGHPVAHDENQPPFFAIVHNHHITEIGFAGFAFVILTLIALYFWRKMFSNSTSAPIPLFFKISLLTSIVLFGFVLWNLHKVSGPDYSTMEFVFTAIVWLFVLFALATLLFGLFVLSGSKMIADTGLHTGLFYAALLQLMAVVILLNLFPDRYYKLCNENCLMHGSQAGTTFDLPCSDNVAFMVHHQTGNHLDMDDYKQAYGSVAPLPLFTDLATPVAMHQPIFPKAQNDPVTFTLSESADDDRNLIKDCSLYVRVRRVSPAEVLGGFTFNEIQNGIDGTLEATWKRTGNILRRTFPGTPVPVTNIAHEKLVSGTAGMITFVTYKFEINYIDATRNPAEKMEITFVLQDYHTHLPFMPAPIYAQGNMSDVMDLLFIPANRPGETVADQADFMDDFRASSGLIIKEAIFGEPSIRFWRKQFNFWINQEAGEVADASCLTCCHTLPENLETLGIPEEIDFKALLHKGTQWDFTDHCNKVFSAEMDLVNDGQEKSSFLHEMGHSVFRLCDEYAGGYNDQATLHLPNNWNTIQGAKHDAHFRHKTEHDAKRIQ